MDWQVTFAGMAAVGAVAAAFFAWMAVLEARRQTRIASGDIEPDFSLFPDEAADFRETARFIVSVRNINRRLVTIESLQLECEPDFAITGVNDDARLAIERAMAEMDGRNFIYNFNPPFVIEGHDPGQAPSKWQKPFRVVQRHGRMGAFQATVGATIKYLINGEHETKTWIGSATVSNGRQHR